MRGDPVSMARLWRDYGAIPRRAARSLPALAARSWPDDGPMMARLSAGFVRDSCGIRFEGDAGPAGSDGAMGANGGLAIRKMN
jgi:hypothetical protein